MFLRVVIVVLGAWSSKRTLSLPTFPPTTFPTMAPSQTPSFAPSFAPTVAPIITSGFLQMTTYSNSPCTDAPTGWSVKQLGICSCTMFNCQIYTAQKYGADSSKSGMMFILSYYGSGNSNLPPTNCTGTPVLVLSYLNTSTTCVQSSDYPSSSSVFIVATYTKNLMPVQYNMGGGVMYNSLSGCQNNVITNLIGEDFNLFGACSIDTTTNNWIKTTCPVTGTTGINAGSVSGGFERLNYYSNSSCKHPAPHENTNIFSTHTLCIL